MRLFPRIVFAVLAAMLLLVMPPLASAYEITLSGVSISALAAGDEGELFVYGEAPARPFPARGDILLGSPGADATDVVLKKISRSGAIVWSALIGGSSWEWPTTLLRDSAGNLIIVGITISTNFPGVPPDMARTNETIFVTKLDSTGPNILFTRTFPVANQFYPSAAATDSQGNIYVAGSGSAEGITPVATSSIVPAPQAIVVLKLSSAGDVVFIRRLGGSQWDSAAGIAVDAGQNIYITGTTSSPDFPLVNPVQPWPGSYSDAFVSKVSADGNQLFYSTFLGGEQSDEGRAIAVTADGVAVVAGMTESAVFPDSLEARDASIPAIPRLFVARLSQSGSNLLRNDFVHLGAVPSISSLKLRSDDTAVLAGSAAYGFPFAVEIGADGARRAIPVVSPCGGASASVTAFANDSIGRTCIAVRSQPRILSAASRDTIKTVGSSPPPSNRPVLIFPRSGDVFGLGESIPIVVADNDFGDSITEVSFFDGRKLLGVVTNAPFSFSWTNAPRGARSVNAIVTSRGAALRTCQAVVRVKPVRNDEPAGAIPLKGDRFLVHGNNLGASGSVLRDVWYSWVAPREGVFRFRIAESNSAFFVAAGTNGNYQYGYNNLRAHAGLRYYIGVGAYGASKFTLVGEPIIPAANDDFANRLLLSGETTSVTGSLASATFEPGDPTDAHAVVWYSWRAPWSTPRDGMFVASVDASSAVSLLVARGASQTNHASPDLTVTRYQPFTAQPGEEFSIAVFYQPGLFFVDPAQLDFTLTVNPVAPPPNDNFENRVFLSGAPISVTNSTFGATREAWEPAHSWFTPLGSLWWSWTAPTSGLYSVAVTGGSSLQYGTGVAVYREDVAAQTSYITSATSPPEAVFAAEAGNTYQIAVADAGSPALVLSIKRVQPPLNDNFADAKIISGSVAAIAGTTSYSTLEGEYYGGFGDSHSVWYRWTAPADGTYTISGSAFSAHRVYVGQGETLADLIWIDSGADVVVRARAGVEYRIAVVSTYFTGPFSFRLREVQTPPNDDFANRAVVPPVQLVLTGSARYATTEPGDPLGGSSLWWSWTAPTTGPVVLRSSSYGSFGVYTGSELSNLVSIAYTYGTKIIFNATAGETYAFGVSPGAQDQVQWVGEQNIPVPANDFFSNAIPVLSTPYSLTNHSAGASSEISEPPGLWSVSARRSLWWKWTPDQDVSISLSTEGSDFLTLLEVFSGSTLETLQPVAFATGGAPDFRAALAIRLFAGSVYYIRVDGGGDNEFGVLRFRADAVPTPPNDDFADRSLLTTNLVHATLAGASRELGEPRSDPTNAVTVWWDWVAPASGFFAAELESVFNLDVYAYSSRFSILDPLYSVYRERNRRPFGSDRYYFNAVAGSNYVFRIGAAPEAAGVFTFVFDQLLPSANDYFSNRVVLSGSEITIAGSNTLATFEEGEPISGFRSVNTVWYEWTSPETRVYRVAASATYPRSICVYSGPSLTNLTRLPTPGYLSGNNGELIFRAAAGVTYYISIADAEFSPPPSLEGIPGTRFNLRLLPAQSPPNDDFANRAPLAGTNVSVSGSNVDATTEPGEPVVGFGTAQTAWWSWTAPLSGPVTIDAQPGFAGAVFTGSSVSNLTLVAGNSYYTLPLTFQAVAGETYAIVIDGNSTFAAPFTLTLKAFPLPPLPLNAALPGFSAPALRLQIPSHAIIQTSTNLKDWAPFQTNTAMAATNVAIPNRPELMRFYRIR